LRERLAGDPVAQQHYAGFDSDRAWLVRLAEDRLQYVSYRKNDQVFWTSKKLRIPRGEVLITDGRHFARTRCGNLLSETPQVQVDAKEPNEALSMPSETPDFLRNPDIRLLPMPPLSVPAGSAAPGSPLLSATALPSTTPKGFPPLAPVVGIPGGYFTGGPVSPVKISTTLPVTNPVAILPTAGTVALIPPVGLNSQLPPVAALIPEPRFLLILPLIVVWMLARGARLSARRRRAGSRVLRTPLRPTLRY
jgi:hypothetical protein